MTYSEDVDEVNRIVSITVTGTLNHELGPLAAASRARAKALGYFVLFDFSESHNYFSIVEAVDWFRKYYDPVDPTLKHVPSAHVVGDQSEDFFRFLEDAWMNRGGNVRMFKDQPSALEWLLEQRR